MKLRLVACLAMSLPLFISLPFGVNASKEWEQFGRSIPVPYDGYRMYSTDVSDDGRTVLAAYNNPSDSDRAHQKKIRVYEFLDGEWVQRGSDLVGPPGFVGEIKLSGDSNTVAIGGTTGSGDNGSLRVFRWSADLGVWTQKGTDIRGASGSQSTQMGVDVSVTGDVVAISAIYGQTINVFDFQDGSWVSRPVLSEMGIRELSLGRNGNSIAVSYFSSNSTGATKVLDWKAESRAWSQRGQVVLGPAGGSLQFIALNESADVLHTTVPKFNNNFRWAGLVRVYEYSVQNEKWQPIGSEIQGEREDHRLSLEIVQNAISNDGSLVLYEEVDVGPRKTYFRIKKWSATTGWKDFGSLIKPQEDEDYISDISLSGNGEVLSLVVYKDPYPEPGFMRVLRVTRPDADGDGTHDELDNCPVDFNPDQTDSDGDNIGDVCDPDVDGDFVNNDYDSCPNTPLGAEVEGTGCSIKQLCPCDSAPNQGQHQSCLVRAVDSFIEVGLLAKQDKGRILSESARSSCGK